MPQQLEYIASECRTDAHLGEVLVIASPQWFREYDGGPVHVTEQKLGFEKFKTVLTEDASGHRWVDPEGKEHRYFAHERVMPRERSVHGRIESAGKFDAVTVRIEVDVASAHREAYWCKAPLQPRVQSYYAWESGRVERWKSGKTRNKNLNLPLKVSEYHLGNGPIAELARHLGGIDTLQKLKGMEVTLSWTDEGVCRISPRGESHGEGLLL